MGLNVDRNDEQKRSFDAVESMIAPVTHSQLQLRSNLGLVNKPTGSTSRPLHAPSTPS